MPTDSPISKSTVTLILVTGMLVSGVCNTILNKYQDMQCVEHCDNPDPNQRRYFEQPVWQTLNMFVGEMAVWIVYVAQLWQRHRARFDKAVPPAAVDEFSAAVVVDDADQNAKHDAVIDSRHPIKGAKSFLLWIPTLCDLTATTVMNVGLLFTSASVYQMLRGTVVIFTGLFSYLFLNRRLRTDEWVSLFLVVIGVSIVGLASALSPQTRPASLDGSEPADGSLDAGSLIGVALVLGAQIFTASQFVIEEKILLRYKITPLKAVGLEGSFGFFSIIAVMPLLHLYLGNRSGYFDIRQGFHDFFDHPAVWQSGIAISISIAFFNWFGLSITRSISATARSTIDACRTLIIWIVSLGLGWEQFSWIQVIGFSVMILGTFYFNGVIRLPETRQRPEENERTPLLQEDS